MEPDPTDLAELNVRQRLSLAQIDVRYGHTAAGPAAAITWTRADRDHVLPPLITRNASFSSGS